MVDTGAADVRAKLRRQDLVQRERDTVGRRTVNRPVTLAPLADAQRPGKRQAVRSAAHFRFWGDDVHIADIAQRVFEREDAVGMIAVVIGYEDPDSIG